MSIVKRLIEGRNKAFKLATLKIFEQIQPVVLDGIIEFMQLQDKKENIHWEDIELVEGRNEPLVILVGTVKYQPGTVILLPNGEEVILTEELAPYFARLIRIGIPISVVEGTKQDVLNFLQKMQDEREQIVEVTSPDEPDEFDLTQLTEEQKQALKMFKQGGTS